MCDLWQLTARGCGWPAFRVRSGSLRAIDAIGNERVRSAECRAAVAAAAAVAAVAAVAAAAAVAAVAAAAAKMVRRSTLGGRIGAFSRSKRENGTTYRRSPSSRTIFAVPGRVSDLGASAGALRGAGPGQSANPRRAQVGVALNPDLIG
jgi:hypothetical protein